MLKANRLLGILNHLPKDMQITYYSNITSEGLLELGYGNEMTVETLSAKLSELDKNTIIKELQIGDIEYPVNSVFIFDDSGLEITEVENIKEHKYYDLMDILYAE